MTREELKRSGLLDQYVLGLLGPEQSEEVARLIDGDPFLEKEVERLRAELNSYADMRNIGPPASGRSLRTAQDFQDLDHEMITAMMERNHSLNIWRYLLIAACLLLIGVSGYLFRLKENVQGELITERSLHAQDQASFEQDLKRNRAAFEATAANWKDVRTYEQPVDSGMAHVHLLAGADLALVDFSDLPAPPEGQAYYLYGGAAEEQPLVVRGEQLSELLPISTTRGATHLRLYRWERGRTRGPDADEQPLALFELDME